MNDDVKQILYYLGAKLDNDILQLDDYKIKVSQVLDKYADNFKGQYFYALYDTVINKADEIENIVFKNTPIVFHSRDLVKHLDGCDRCFLMYLTLGFDIDKIIMSLQKTDMLEAVILDAVSSHMLEKECDKLQKQLKQSIEKNCELTNRFSPGYGDLELSENSIILDVLQAQKRAGIVENDDGLMSPSKTVTAIIGVKTL